MKKRGRKPSLRPKFNHTIGLNEEAHTKLTKLSEALDQTRAQIASDLIIQYYDTFKE